MVGDLVLDVLAAKRANGACMLVRRLEQSNSTDPYMALPAEFLYNTKETMTEKSDFGANYIVHSLTEIPAIIQNEIRRQDSGSES